MKPFTLPRWRFMNCCGHVWGHRPAPQASAEAPNGASGGDSVKTAAAGVAGLAALATLPKSAAAQVRVFPPPPPAVSPIEGLIDFHNHCGAVVLKNHVALTADRAWLVRKHNPGIKAFGGVTLNAAAGGINPDAVQWMWRMQGGCRRVVVVAG